MLRGFLYDSRRRSLHQHFLRRLGGFWGRVEEESSVMSEFELLKSRLWIFLYEYIAVCLTVRRCRSVCIVSFKTYRGAFRMRRKALDWRVCNLLIFYIYAAPHSSMP